MAAYLIADVDITDAAVFDQYRREVPATEERYGGRYLARGGATKVFEATGTRTASSSSNFPTWHRFRPGMTRRNTSV